MKKVADDAAKQGESAAKEKAKSAADPAIDSVGSGTVATETRAALVGPLGAGTRSSPWDS
jgi:hypothetical protein